MSNIKRLLGAFIVSMLVGVTVTYGGDYYSSDGTKWRVYKDSSGDVRAESYDGEGSYTYGRGWSVPDVADRLNLDAVDKDFDNFPEFDHDRYDVDEPVSLPDPS